MVAEVVVVAVVVAVLVRVTAVSVSNWFLWVS
jgi:hypothetical protein